MAKRVSLASLSGSIGSNSTIDGAKAPTAAAVPVSAGPLVVEQGAEGVFLANVPVEDLAGNPRNPRDHLKNLDDLSTIVEQQLQPGSVVTRASWLALFPHDDAEIGDAKYVVVNGNRRLAAAREFGRPGLDVVIRDSLAKNEVSVMIAAVLENLAREDLDVIEEAKAVDMLVKSLPSAAAAAKMLGRSAGWVSQRRVLLELTPDLQEKLRAGELGIREARVLGRVPREEQVEAWMAELDRKDVSSVDPGPDAQSDTSGETEDSDRAELTPVDKIVKVLKGQKADPETVAAALEEHFDAADLIQLKAMIK